MLKQEMEIPDASEVVDAITDAVLATVSTEPIIDREIIRQSVIRGFEKFGLLEVI